MDVLYLCNSMLAGMVSVSASCDRINTWSAILIGFLSQILYSSSKVLFIRLEIDDPLEITSVHGICGLWSLIASGLFDLQVGLIYQGNIK